MAIYYRISKRRDNLSDPPVINYMLQAVSTGEIDVDRLSYEISSESTLSEVDVRAVLDALGIKLQQHLSQGKTVTLANVGRFKIGFKSEGKRDQKQLRPQDISKFHINYQPSAKLKRWLKHGFELKKKREGRI